MFSLRVLDFAFFSSLVLLINKLVVPSRCYYSFFRRPVEAEGLGGCSPLRFWLKLTFNQLTIIVKRKKEPKNITI